MAKDWRDSISESTSAFERRDYKTAQKNCEEAIKSVKNDPQVAVADKIRLYNILGKICTAQKKLVEAETAYSQALALSEETDGNGKPLHHENMEVAETFLGLKQTYKLNKRYEDSERAARKALEIADKNLKNADARLEPYISNVLDVACLNGVCKDESPLTTRLYELRTAVYGPDDPKTFASRQMLAESYEHHKRFVQAEELYRKNLESADRTGRSTNAPRINLARTMSAAGHHAEAQKMIAIVLMDKTDPSMQLNAKHVQAQVLANAGQYTRAKKVFAGLLDSMKQTVGPNNSLLAHYYFEYADILRNGGDESAAKKAEQQGSTLANQTTQP